MSLVSCALNNLYDFHFDRLESVSLLSVCAHALTHIANLRLKFLNFYSLTNDNDASRFQTNYHSIE